MPYITQDLRSELNPHIEMLVELLAWNDKGSRVGMANYAITKILKDAFPEPKNYADYNSIIGVLECAKLEFYREFVVPYEKVKREINGAV